MCYINSSNLYIKKKIMVIRCIISKTKEDIGIKTCVVILIQKFHNGLINVFVALRPRTYRTHQVKYNYLIINYINATKYCTDMFRFVLLEST